MSSSFFCSSSAGTGGAGAGAGSGGKAASFSATGSFAGSALGGSGLGGGSALGGSGLGGSGLGSSLAGAAGSGAGGGGAVATGVGFGASFLATSGRRLSLGWACNCLASREPNRSLVTSAGVTRSMATGSGSATARGASIWMLSTAQPSTAACRHREMISPKCTLPFEPLGPSLVNRLSAPGQPRPLLDILGPAHEGEFIEAALAHGASHLGDGSVDEMQVATNKLRVV